MNVIREMLIRIGVKADNKELKRVDYALKDIKRGAIGLTASLIPVAMGMNKIVMAGAEAEKRQVSFETMLGNVEDAKNLMESVRNLSLETPFKFEEAAGTTKMLLAMGSSLKDVMGDARMLGDVSAGLNVPMSRLALNFGQVRTAGQLTGRELRDFTVAGVPLLAELSKITGKTTKQLKEMIPKGDIDFAMVAKAFKNMTSEGGKFNNLMAKMSKTTGGLISNFGVLVDLTLEDIGKNFNNKVAKRFLENLFEWSRENDNLKKSIESLIIAGTALAGVVALWGAGKILIGVSNIALALTGLGNAAMIAQLKFIAFPLLAAVAFSALGLLVYSVYENMKDPKLNSYFHDLLNIFEVKLPRGLNNFRSVLNLAFDEMAYGFDMSILKAKLFWKLIDKHFGLDDNAEVTIKQILSDMKSAKYAIQMSRDQYGLKGASDAMGVSIAPSTAQSLLRPEQYMTKAPSDQYANMTLQGGVSIYVTGNDNPKETAKAVLNAFSVEMQRKMMSGGTNQ